ncbi:MAG: hypothetical protein AAB427_12645 [Chloroflexota bacterium]
MNALAIQQLETIRRVVKPRERNNAGCLFVELFSQSVAMRDAEIYRRANRIWAVHDGPALLLEFGKRISPKGFNVGFSFDISDVDEDDDAEQWAAAWQLAIESLDTDPPELPEFDLDGIKAWLEQTSQPQLALF